MADTATVAVLFCDLVSSTERQSRLGDDAADDFRRRFFAALRSPLTTTGGTEIKTLGDGLMATFESTTGAILCAVAMHRAMRELDPDDPVLLRIGISIGEVGHEDGDWFGTPVVEAARLCAVATAGGTYATAVVQRVVGSRGSRLRFTELGPMQLKGLPAPVDVVAVFDEDDEQPVPPPPVIPPPSHAVPAGDVTTRRAGRMRTLAALVLGMLIIAGSAWVLDVAVDHDDDGGHEPTRRAGGTVTEPSGYRPSFRSVACSSDVAAEVTGAECGQLIVPEVRAKPLGDKIHVDVVKAPATDAPTSPPVLLADLNEPLGRTPLRRNADVYSVGLRGLSPFDEPRLTCPELRETWLATLSLPPDDLRAIDQRATSAGACAKRLRARGVKLEGYNLVEAGADLRDLVLALDLGRVSVAAGGVWTPAAVSFARANPGAVESLLLSNPTPPGESPLTDPASDLSNSLDALVALCKQVESCKHRDLPADYAARVDEYAAAPKSVLTTPLGREDLAEPAVEVLLDGRRMAAALATALKSSDQLRIVPTAISPGGARDGILAAASINDDLLFFGGEDAVAGAILSYTCSYDAPQNRVAEVTDVVLSRFAGANNPSLQRLCAAWDVPVVLDHLDQPLSGEVPVFFSEGGLSAAGVNRWSDQMAANLPNSTVVHLPTLSEDVAFRQPACLQALRRAFLADPTVTKSVRGCEAQSPPIQFV